MEIILHAGDYTVEKDSLRTYIDLNLSGKMDTYIKKLSKETSQNRLELTVERQNDKLAKGKLVITVGGVVYRSEREDFDNLSDLVNHLFTHIKEKMAK